MEISDAKARLRDRIESVVHHLLPNGKRVGKEWAIGSLTGAEGDSLKVNLSSDRAGVWSDFATGESGDVIELWSKVKRLSYKDTFADISLFLGDIKDNKRDNRYKRPDIRKEKLDNTAVQYLGSRGLSKNTIERFRITNNNDNITFPSYRDGELIMTKTMAIARKDGRKKIWASRNTEPCLFGWQALDDEASYVIICEGEIDAMTVSQWGFPSLSVPFGAGAGEKQRWIECEYHNLERFETIYICMDADSAGKDAMEEISMRLGRHRCKIIELDCKDPNEMLVSHNCTSSDFQYYIDKAMELDPDVLKRGTDFADEIYEYFYPTDREKGVSLPWKKLEETMRLRPGEVTLWTGINGHGKTQLIGQCMLHIMRQGVKVCIASMELSPSRVVGRMVRQAMCTRQPTEEHLKSAMQWIDDKLWVHSFEGEAKLSDILDTFEYAARRYRVEHFVIDSMMMLDVGSEDYEGQRAFIGKLCDFKRKLGCHIHLVAHPRKLINEDLPPSKMDIAGSGNISNMADNAFIIWRNKRKERELSKAEHQRDDKIIAKPDALFIVDKQRNDEGWLGQVGLWYNKVSAQFLEYNTESINYLR